MLCAVGFSLVLGKGKGLNAGRVTKRVSKAARDDRVVGVVCAPIAEVGYSWSQTALVVAFCGKACVEGLL